MQLTIEAKIILKKMDGTQNYLVFQGVYKYFEDVDVSKTLIKFHANSWISKGLSN